MFDGYVRESIMPPYDNIERGDLVNIRLKEGRKISKGKIFAINKDSFEVEFNNETIRILHSDIIEIYRIHKN